MLWTDHREGETRQTEAASSWFQISKELSHHRRCMILTKPLERILIACKKQAPRKNFLQKIKSMRLTSIPNLVLTIRPWGFLGKGEIHCLVVIFFGFTYRTET